MPTVKTNIVPPVDYHSVSLKYAFWFGSFFCKNNPLKEYSAATIFMLLQPEQRAKIDPTDDSLFYDYPRFVTHVDAGFIGQLTDLYRQRLQPQTRILDLMSSWVSHLPPELEFAHVEGHGLNAEELAKNSRLHHYFVQNLNQDPKLPLPDQSFDAVLITVSVQYVQYPEALFTEIHRILKPGGLAIISFSNRMFWQKAIQVWRDGSEPERVELVKGYFQAVPGFAPPEVIAKSRGGLSVFNWFQGGGDSSDPFYAVLSQRY
jgi:SAM-dependent methyltransferase